MEVETSRSEQSGEDTHIEDLIQRARSLLQLSATKPKETAIQLLDEGYPPDLIVLSVRAAMTPGPRKVPYPGEKGYCPFCGAPGTFDLYGEKDMPRDWISLERWGCYKCMWESMR